MSRLARLGVMSGLLAMTPAHSPLFAQRDRSFDTGVATVYFPDDDAALVGPWARFALNSDGLRHVASLSAVGVADPGGATGSSTLAGAWRALVGPRWVLEGGGEGSLIYSSTSGSAQSALASARLIGRIGQGSGWVRASGDLARRSTGALGGHGISAGVWHPLPNGTVSASVARQWTEGLLYQGAFRTGLLGTTPVRYTEGVAELHLEGQAATLDLSLGARHDPDAAQRLEAIANATAVLWSSASRAFTVTLARLPADYVRRADAMQMLAVGMRFGPRPGAALRAAAARPTVTVAEVEGVTLLRVRAPGAHRVEVIGDFTDWQPVELLRPGELFERSFTIEPGSHRMQLRIDGGPWISAANTPAVDDDLGGKVGLLVVP